MCPEGYKKLKAFDYVTVAQTFGKFVRHKHPPHFTPGKYLVLISVRFLVDLTYIARS